MREYETVYILKPDLPSDRTEKIADKVSRILKEGKAELLGQKDWGKRKLAYPFRSCSSGHYFYFNYLGDGRLITDLERTLKYEEEVVRFLTVKVGEAEAAKKRGPQKKLDTLDEGQGGFFESPFMGDYRDYDGD